MNLARGSESGEREGRRDRATRGKITNGAPPGGAPLVCFL